MVNLAARLMSKAHGEILLDQKTYSRLPEVILKKLIKRPLMAVKGKTEPIETYQFDSTHTVQADGRLGAPLVDDSIEEELPIRKICRDVFTAPLKYLSSNAPIKNIQVSHHTAQYSISLRCLVHSHTPHCAVLTEPAYPNRYFSTQHCKPYDLFYCMTLLCLLCY